MTTTYRKRPVEVEAAGPITKDNADWIADWSGGRVVSDGPGLSIPTLEGEMRADPGDYVIRGIAGEFYPCKPDIFAATYERTEPHPITGEPEPVCVCGRRQSMHAPDGGCSGFAQDEAEWQRRMDAQNASAGSPAKPAAEFLWGLHGAETFHIDPATCYARDLEQYAHPADRHPREIEQWTSLSAEHFLPSPAEVAEYVAEWGADNMGTDGAAEAWDEARRDPEVVAAFAVASQLLASRVAYWMCGDLVATHTLSWTDNGEPLLDGEPLYVTTKGARA